MNLGVEAILGAFEGARSPQDADFGIVATDPAPRSVHLALSRDGLAALLVPLGRVAGDTTRLTQGVALRSAAAVQFSRGAERWREPAAVIECRDAQLLRTFAGMAAAIIARLDSRTKPSLEAVTSLFAEWERLMGRRKLLKGESELGLWGELWCFAHSSRSEDLVAAWRGPEGERVDFILGGLGVEVKAGRRAGVHLLSQSQVGEKLGELRVVLLSLHVMPDPLRGRSLAELVQHVGGQIADVASFEEKLATVGYSRGDEAAYGRRMVLVQAPLFYPAERIPRVRAADPGVSQIRYRVELPRDAALEGQTLDAVTTILGLNLESEAYPCA